MDRRSFGPRSRAPAPQVAVPGAEPARGTIDEEEHAVDALEVGELDQLAAKRDRLRQQYLRSSTERPTTATQGVHHLALLCSDVERTIRFYQDLLELPLTELFENRDYRGSTHFFFDIGHGNALAFFDFPGLDLGPYAEVLGGLHHVALSVDPERWEHLKGKLEAAGVPTHQVTSSLYFSDPDGTRLELLAQPLGEMYGRAVV
jgi:catechol 2,3-dioxygenase-like lactoylglutathione lyase family enzyme